MGIKYWELRFVLTRKPAVDFVCDEDAIRLIKEEGCSLSRFGDGEFRWMQDLDGFASFQKGSSELARALNRVFTERNDRILIGIPRPMIDNRHCTRLAKYYWNKFTCRHIGWLRDSIPLDKRYVDTNITRPYIDYKKKESAKYRFDQVKSIWENRDVLIVEGRQTKFGVGNDLLHSCRSVKRVICPAVDAFDVYDEIVSNVLKYAANTDLILLSLGPTASVLAYDLTLLGYQAVDIGHFDVEYEWFLRGATGKIPIKGKYVNECNDYGDGSLDNLPFYRESVVALVEG